MNKVDEKILNFCGIYQKPEITEKKMKKIFKQKKELEELTGMRIEKIYVFGEKYWGKNTDIDRAAVCFLVDERIQRLNEVETDKLQEEIKNKEKIINELKVDENIEFACKINKYESKRKRNDFKTINRKKSKEIKNEISDKSKLNLGIEGEKYLNKDESKINMTIIKNPYDIFLKNTEILKNITFYTQY